MQAVPGLRFTGLAASLVVIATIFCLAHGLVIDAEINLPHTLRWAVVSTLPWVCAWEGLRRVDARFAQRLQPLAQIVHRMLRRPPSVRAIAPAPAERVFDIPTRNGALTVRAADVEYVKAAGNYVELIAGDRTHLMRATLHDLDEQLREAGFVRVHRSLLVNSVHVVAVRRGPRGRQLVKLSSGAELPVGRQFDVNARSFVTIARRSSLRP